MILTTSGPLVEHSTTPQPQPTPTPNPVTSKEAAHGH